jgi:hypothetical protein
MNNWLYGAIIFFAFTSGLIYTQLSYIYELPNWVIIIVWSVVFSIAYSIKLIVDNKEKEKLK